MLIAIVVSLVVYAISFVLLRLLSRYRELCADRSGAYLTMKPQALASALTKIAGGVNAIPQKDLRSGSAVNSLFIVPAVRGVTLQTLTCHPPVARAAPRAARPHPGRARPAHRLMRWLDAVTGRRRQAANDLDALFLVPSAAITLETAAGYAPTGIGSVCYRSAAGAALRPDARTRSPGCSTTTRRPPTSPSARDDFGFTWLVVQGDPADTAGLCTDLHAVNTLLEEQGFASGLLCSMVSFTGHGRTASGWSTSTSRARSTPSRPRARTSATTSPRSPYATCSRPSSPWSGTCSAGSRCGMLPDCDLARRLVAFSRKARHDLQNPRGRRRPSPCELAQDEIAQRRRGRRRTWSARALRSAERLSEALDTLPGRAADWPLED